MDPSLSNPTPMDLLKATESSLCTHHLASLRSTLITLTFILFGADAAVQQLVAISSCSRCNLSFTLSRFMWCWVTQWGVLLAFIAQNNKKLLAHVQIWNVCVLLPSFTFVQFKILVYGHMYANRLTYTHVLQCSPASVRFLHARPNWHHVDLNITG